MTHGSRGYWLRASVVIVAVSLVTLQLEHLGWLERFETAGLDTFNILQPTRDPTHVVMVGISDEYYQERFKARSPLDCEPVREIVTAIAKGRPRVIGVDLDTSSGDFTCMNGLPDEWPPIVWAQDAVGGPPSGAFKPLPILKSPLGTTMRAIDRAGLIKFPVESDGVIRHYARRLPVEGGAVDSFPWLTVKTTCAGGCAHCCEDAAANVGERLRLNFAGERFSLTPLSVELLFKGADTEGWATSGPLHDRVVLLGGNYREARDTYVTPVGERTGLQILAQSIESELEDGGIRGVNWAIAFALDLAVGFLLVAVHLRFEHRPGVMLATTLLLMPVLALASSLIAFSTLSLWFNFAPVIVSVLMHQLYEHAREHAALSRSAR